MLGKASEIKTETLESWFGAHYSTEEVSTKMNDWLSSHPNAVILQTNYATYQATDSEDNLAYGERILIIYKEANNHE